MERNGVDLPIHVRVTAAEMSTWQPERISAFFAGIAKLEAAAGPRPTPERPADEPDRAAELAAYAAEYRRITEDPPK